MKLILDNRTGNVNNDVEIEECDKDTLLQALDKLNGRNHTMLSIEREDNYRMDIGGGCNLFVVTCTTASCNNLTLLNPAKNVGDETIELCAGGQYSEFPKGIVVEKEIACKAAASFLEKSEKYLDWVQE